MKFLCLHGAYGNESNFQAQMGPFLSKASKSDKMSFKFISAQHEAIPPPGFENYFGCGPLRRFVRHDGTGTVDDVLRRLDDFPQGETAEDTIRQLFKLVDNAEYNTEGVSGAIEYILDILRADPEIDGILGFSEGAIVAASTLLEEKRRWEEEGIPRQLKCGIFFGGWPPISLRGGRGSVLLADESEDVIDVPTCHVVGCEDPFIDGAMALYSMCDQDSAEFFDHGNGHFIPREPQTCEELTANILALVEKAEARFTPAGDSDSVSDSAPSPSLDGEFSQGSLTCSSRTSVSASSDGDLSRGSLTCSSRTSVSAPECGDGDSPLDSLSAQISRL
ncbi:hypothetical protein E4U43_004672 [Claviceps pusilla]|uniref:Serine hydrolase domain-containing protein n=1 Tax=Claviceps pusilla TaxID=123648 RepID=A0A9P7STT9_9HYPO|nr:hypothetical protein E4U43_004672 [Claviceps pusilla]